MKVHLFPIFSGYISGKEFGQDVPGEAKYRKLKDQFAEQIGSGNWVLMPPIPIHPMRI